MMTYIRRNKGDKMDWANDIIKVAKEETEESVGIKIEHEHEDLYRHFEKILKDNDIEMPMDLDEFANWIRKAHNREFKNYYLDSDCGLVRMEEELKKGKQASVKTAGTWNLGTEDEIQTFINEIEKIKDKYYKIVGDDIVFDGLDGAIRRADELKKKRNR